jgi:hypothetical protein
LAVHGHVAIEDDDRVGGGVAVGAGSRTGPVANHVVLGTGPRVVVEEIELEGPVVGWLLGGVQRDRTQIRMDDGTSHGIHHYRVVAGPSSVGARTPSADAGAKQAPGVAAAHSVS